MAPTGNKPSEQDEQTTLVTAKAGSLDAAGSDDELLAQKCVLGEQLTARTGQIGDKATRDRRRPARVAERAHHAGGQLGNRDGKMGDDNAEQRAHRSESVRKHQALFGDAF